MSDKPQQAFRLSKTFAKNVCIQFEYVSLITLFLPAKFEYVSLLRYFYQLSLLQDIC